MRESDIWDKSFTERAPKLGGLIEFYRSPARVQWTPTGNNVPDYPKLAQLWWQNIGDASSGTKTPQAAMDALAAAQDSVLERLEKSGVQGACGPKMNKKETAEFWFKKAEKDGTIAPQRKLANEKPKGETVDYDALIKSWPATPAEAGRGEAVTFLAAVVARTIADTSRSCRTTKYKGRERSRPFSFLPRSACGESRIASKMRSGEADSPRVPMLSSASLRPSPRNERGEGATVYSAASAFCSVG